MKTKIIVLTLAVIFAVASAAWAESRVIKLKPILNSWPIKQDPPVMTPDQIGDEWQVEQDPPVMAPVYDDRSDDDGKTSATKSNIMPDKNNDHTIIIEEDERS